MRHEIHNYPGLTVDNSIRIGYWEFRKGTERTMLPETKIALEDLVSRELFGQCQADYPYFFLQKTGCPSPILRIDFSPEVAMQDPTASVYEIEFRPAGIGIMTHMFGQVEPFKALFEDIATTLNLKMGLKVCPSIVGRGTGKDRSKDTELFSSSLGLAYFNEHQLPGEHEYGLWVRGGMEDEEYLSNDTLISLENMALAPVRDHGNKKYLVEMGLACRINDPEELDFNTAFCIKPLKGSKCQGIGLWNPDTKKASGIATKTKIERLIQESGQPYIIQPFIPPKLVQYDGNIYNLIYRVFALLNLATNQYKIIGGLYTARPNFLVHGTSDSIIGLVCV